MKATPASQPKRIGKYDILEPLGRGGVGTVYKGYQADLDRHVAIKVMIAGEHASEELIRRFLREARAAASLVHSGIVQIHDIGSEGSLHHIVMEWVEGGSLSEKLASGPLASLDALRICAEVAESLSEAHERGVIHRDIKPSNILLDAKRRPKIADFGLAVSLEEDERLTRTGDILGTPCYMSPEQAFGSPDEVDARTDIYSLGAVLYELLTGRPPFEAPNAFSILKRIELEDPAPPSSRRPELGTGLDALVLQALEKEPARRYATMDAFATALRGAVEERKSLPPPAKIIRTARYQWIAAAAIVVVLALAAGRLITTSAPRETSAVDSPAARPDRLHSVFVRKTLIPCLSSPLTMDPVEANHSAFAKKFLAALDAVRSGKEAEAMQIADAWMERPTAEAFLCRAVVLEHLGRYERVQEALRIARALDPQDPFPVLYGFAVAVCYQKDLETDPRQVATDILEHVGPLAQKDPKAPGPPLFLGIAHLVQGNRKLAQDSFAAARERSGPVIVPPNLRPSNLNELLAAAGVSESRFLVESGRFLMQYKLPGAEAELREAIERSAKEDKTVARDVRRIARLSLAELQLAANPEDAIAHLRAGLSEGLDLDSIQKDPRFVAFLGDSRNLKAVSSRDPGTADPKPKIKDGDRGRPREGDGDKGVPK